MGKQSRSGDHINGQFAVLMLLKLKNLTYNGPMGYYTGGNGENFRDFYVGL